MNQVHIVHPLDQSQTKQYSMTDDELTKLAGNPKQHPIGHPLVHPGIASRNELSGVTIITTKGIDYWMDLVEWIRDERKRCR